MDASVVIKWMVGEPGSDQAAAVMLGPVAAPDLLVSECINALWKKVTRGELSAGEAEAAALVLQSAAITFEPVQALAAQILELSMRLSHPAYDCAYLALARRLQLPLVTADEKLAARCSRKDVAGLVPVVQRLSDIRGRVMETAAAYLAPKKRARMSAGALLAAGF